MIKSRKCYRILLAVAGYVGVSISVIGLVGDCAMRRHYVRDGCRSKVSLSAYLKKMESDLLDGRTQERAVFQQMAISHELLIDDVLDYLLIMRLLSLVLLCISAVVLLTRTRQQTRNSASLKESQGQPLKIANSDHDETTNP